MAAGGHTVKAQRIQIKLVYALCVMSNPTPGGLPVTVLPRTLTQAHTHLKGIPPSGRTCFMFQYLTRQGRSISPAPNIQVLLVCCLYPSLFFFTVCRMEAKRKVSSAPTVCSESCPRYSSHVFINECTKLHSH